VALLGTSYREGTTSDIVHKKGVRMSTTAAATSVPIPVIYAKVLSEEENNEAVAQELQWTEQYSYQSWQDPNAVRAVRAVEPLDDPFSFWITCMCLFFFIVLIVLLIWSIEYYDYDDDYY